MEKGKAAFLPGKLKRKILAKHSLQKLVSPVSVHVNGEILLKKHLSSHI